MNQPLNTALANMLLLLAQLFFINPAYAEDASAPALKLSGRADSGREVQPQTPIATARATAAHPAIPPNSTLESYLTHGGVRRTYLVHIPTTYNPAHPTPVLLAFHGGGGSAAFQADERRYGLISKSDKEGFIAVFPGGVSPLASGFLGTWNAGACCGGARDRQVDDVGFVAAVLDQVERTYHVDRTRVFATGMSNGAMMSYRLACELSERVRAIAAVAGTDNTLTCTPKRPVPVLHIHALNDDHVLFSGGSGKTPFAKASVTDFVSVQQTLAKWRAINGAGPFTKVWEGPGARCEEAPGPAPVRLCVTDSGGHSWPGGAKGRGDPASTALSANDAMWEFFMRVSR